MFFLEAVRESLNYQEKYKTMKHTIQNEYLSACIDELGAELKSLRRNDKMGTELLWSGDPAYWSGQSPILFPAVGNCRDGKALFDGATYEMPKHGFARHTPFSVTAQSTTSITLSLNDTEETHACFPHSFCFSVTYELVDSSLHVSFRVENPASSPLPYHLGAHPAFALPDFKETDSTHGYLSFDVTDKLVSQGLKPKGLLWPEGAFDVPLNSEGLLALTNETFACDTILDARGTLGECSLLDKEKRPVVRLRFQSPILALWAPKKGCAPFVCIEPWWGCCDIYDFCGEYAERRWTNLLQPGMTNTHGYIIDVL